jgi:hypothetical protein
MVVALKGLAERLALLIYVEPVKIPVSKKEEVRTKRRSFHGREIGF